MTVRTLTNSDVASTDLKSNAADHKTPKTSQAISKPLLTSLPRELIDHILDFVVDDQPYQKLAAVSHNFHHLARQQASRTLRTAPQLQNRPTAPQLSVGDWLKLDKAYLYLKSELESLKAPAEQTDNLKPAIRQFSQVDSIVAAYKLRKFKSLQTAAGRIKKAGLQTLQKDLVHWQKTQRDSTRAAEACYRIEKAYMDGDKVLDLSDLHLSTLPDCIAQLRFLTELCAFGNFLTVLPEGVLQLKKLKSLTLFSNRLKKLPDDIIQLKELKHLTVSFNKLEKLPAGLGKLVNLETLFCSNNRLIALPASITQLASLKVLMLESNKDLRLPAGVEAMQALKFLCFDADPAVALGSQTAAVLKQRGVVFQQQRPKVTF